jgi:HEAT repeat protein
VNDVFDLFCDLVSNLKSRSVRLRREAIAAIGQVADRSCTNVLIDAIKAEPDLEVRASLIKTVGAVGTANLIPFLETFLSDPDPRCRSNTIEALGRFPQEKERILPMIARLLTDPDNRVIGTAIKVMHELGDDAGLSMLSNMLRGDDNARRCTAIWCVGEILLGQELPTLVEYLGSPVYRVHTITAQALKKFGRAATPHLLGALAGADRFRRAYIALSLGESGGEPAVATLRGLLEDPDEMVILHSLSALGRLADRTTTPDVLRLLHAKQPDVRCEALKTLRLLGDASVCPMVVGLIERETEAHALSAAATLIGALGAAEHVDALKPLLRHADSRVRANAVESLGRIGDRKIIEEIRPFLSDPDNRVMANTAIALYEFGDVKVVDLLGERLKTGDERVRMSVAYALGEIPLEDVVAPLVSAVADQSALVRKRVLASLAKKGATAQSALSRAVAAELGGEPAGIAAGLLGVRQALAPLLERWLKKPAGGLSLTAEGRDTTERIASLFGSLRTEIQRQQIQLPAKVRSADGDVLSALRELAAADDPRLRCFSVCTLGELRSREAVGTLLCLLHDPDESVRAYTADALGKIGDKRAVRFLEAKQEDEAETVRRAAGAALEKIATPRVQKEATGNGA